MEIAVYNSFIFVFIFKVIPKIFFLVGRDNIKMGVNIIEIKNPSFEGFHYIFVCHYNNVVDVLNVHPPFEVKFNSTLPPFNPTVK